MDDANMKYALPFFFIINGHKQGEYEKQELNYEDAL